MAYQLPKQTNNDGLAAALARLSMETGGLTLRLACTQEDIHEAQALRYAVFAGEMGADLPPETHARRRDADDLDALCDHMLVISPEGRVIGAYRIFRRSVAANAGVPFYTESEFDLSALLEAFSSLPEIAELGRACVQREYRSGKVINLLWRGIATYCAWHEVRLLFGCASFPGTDWEVHADTLAFLYAQQPTPANIAPRALPERGLMIPTASGHTWNKRETTAMIRRLPSLLRGYMAVGALFSPDIVIDPVYRTTDICTVLPLERIPSAYIQRYMGG